MQIKQWEDKNLSHFSYAILSDCEKKLVLIDPARDPQPYIEYAKQHEASIIGVIETHPHADFISCHAELPQLTGAKIYVSKLVNAGYPHEGFDDGDTIQFGKIKLTALNTPGHSPDSISVLLEHDGKQKAVFTGDTLFIGDCGRPDLREDAADVETKRESLARQMYTSLRKKLMVLEDEVLVYPAHGAGSLCGKALSDAQSSTIGAEKMTNWSLQEMTTDEFVEKLLADQPFVPAYFPFNVKLNKQGAPAFRESIEKVPFADPLEINEEEIDKQVWVIDTRDGDTYKNGHFPHSINLQAKGKFETWLGTMIKPGEAFYLAGVSKEQLEKIIERVAVIGYEEQIKMAFIIKGGNETMQKINVDEFASHENDYTIVDVRNTPEVKDHKIFDQSINIPLPELKERFEEIPLGKPIVVHCAGGYRSAAASSFLQSQLPGSSTILDLGDAIKKFN